VRIWNKGQSEAIEARHGNVLVSASAGTGKTAVLVERLIRRLTDPVSPLGMDRFVFVTFTNAAAREMKRRVRNELDLRAWENPGDRLLARQLRLLGKAEISTLHSFCLELIRTRGKDLGLDPKSRVLNDPERILLQGETLDELMEERYQEGAPGIAALSAAYGGDRSDDGLKRLALRLAGFAATRPWPSAWLKRCVSVYSDQDGAKRLIPFLKEHIAEKIRALTDELERGIAMAARLASLEKYAACLSEDRDKLLAILRIEEWDSVIGAMGTGAAVFGRLPSVLTKIGKNETERDYESRAALQPAIKAIRERCKNEFKRLALSEAGETVDEIRGEIASMAPAMLELASIVGDFFARYEAAKRDKAVLDFWDIERYAAMLLFDENGEPTDTARELKSQYDEILVDEYQDINPVQEAIIQALRGESLVMVGDIKQSVYGFRQAAPRLFNAKYEAFKNGEGGVAIRLDDTYRSSQWLVNGINQVFDHCMTKKGFDLDYAKEGRFACGVPFDDRAEPLRDAGAGLGALELHILDMSEIGQVGPTSKYKGELNPKTLESTSESKPESDPDTNPDANPGPDPDADLDFLSNTEGSPDRDDFERDDFERDGFGRDGFGRDDPGRGWARALDAGSDSGISTLPDDSSETMPDIDSLRAEAMFCAARIKRLVRESIWDRRTNALRPVRLRDIVILLPSMKGVAGVFEQALRDKDIPVFADIGGGYFQAQEVQVALSFLKVLDNPRQDIPLASLMLSPAVGFTPADLGHVRAAYRQARGEKESDPARAAEEAVEAFEGKWGGLYKALLYYAANPGAGADGFASPGEIAGFIAEMDAYREYARRASVADVLTRFYEESGFLIMSSAMATGARRRANLLALVDRAREFEETNLQGLYQFMRYIDTLIKRGNDLSPAPSAGEGEDLVRIMSIHKSKGLEFPIVILGTTGRSFNMSDLREDLLIHESLGAASRVIMAERRVKYSGAYHMAVAQKLRAEAVAERMRVLYVAMTRAEQRLIALCADKQAGKRALRWSEEKGLYADNAGAANSFIDWIGPAVYGNMDRDHNQWVSRIWRRDEIFALDAAEDEAGAKARRAIDGVSTERLAIVGDPAEKIKGLPMYSSLSDGSTADESPWDFVGRQLEWVYPWKSASEKSAKLSVTQAKGRLYPEDDPEAAPARWTGIYTAIMDGPEFLRQDGGMNSAQRGTLLHRVLAKLRPAEAKAFIDTRSNTARITDTQSGVARSDDTLDDTRTDVLIKMSSARQFINDLLDNLIENEYITDKERDTVDTNMLAAYLLSGIFARVADADALGLCAREASFIMAVPASRLYPDTRQASADAEADKNISSHGAETGVEAGVETDAKSDDDQVVVQGIIDLYFEEEGSLVLLDFKSDNAAPGDEDRLIQRYSGQLRLYSEGLEKFTGKRVKEALIYSLPLGKTIPMS